MTGNIRNKKLAVVFSTNPCLRVKGGIHIHTKGRHKENIMIAFKYMLMDVNVCKTTYYIHNSFRPIVKSTHIFKYMGHSSCLFPIMPHA